jgi:hypothetical protein
MKDDLPGQNLVLPGLIAIIAGTFIWALIAFLIIVFNIVPGYSNHHQTKPHTCCNISER